MHTMLNHFHYLAPDLSQTMTFEIPVGENFGKFGETNFIHQCFTQPNFRFAEVANSQLFKLL